MTPLAIDLYCGLGGWTEGLLAEGWEVVGFDLERHAYGDHHYPAQLVLQDVLTLHGSQFKSAALIVASPPCQRYSYMAMPWSRAKALIAWYRESPERIAELNALFDACFRIQREAIEAAGHFIPLVVENVRGAIPWVGRSRWNFGSFHLWGDVPALMPMVAKRGGFKEMHGSKMGGGQLFSGTPDSLRPNPYAAPKNYQLGGGSWFVAPPGRKCASGNNPDGRKQTAMDIIAAAKEHGGKGYAARLGESKTSRESSSKSSKRKAASAMIAKIPLVLARHIGSVYKPRELCI